MEAFAPEPDLFERIVLPHLDGAYGLARWLLRHDQDAEDATQEAFLRAHKSFRTFHRTQASDGRAWLLTIVRNVCYSRLARERNAAAEPFDDEVHGISSDAAPADAVAWAELKGETLRDALMKLRPEFRETIVLHALEGLSYREIAEVIGVPIGTVMSRLARARARLQVELSSLAGENE